MRVSESESLGEVGRSSQSTVGASKAINRWGGGGGMGGVAKEHHMDCHRNLLRDDSARRLAFTPTRCEGD